MENLVRYNNSTLHLTKLNDAPIDNLGVGSIFTWEIAGSILKIQLQANVKIDRTIELVGTDRNDAHIVVKNNGVITGILDLPVGTTPGLVAPDNQTIKLTGTTIGVKPGSINRSHLDTNLAGKIDKIEVASVEEVKTYFGITE